MPPPERPAPPFTPGWKTAPANVSILPASGSGFTQQFTWTASSPLGFANLSDLFALFNASVSGVNACYLHYNRASNLLSIANAAGTAWSSGIVPGGSGITGGFNPYCTLNGSGSSVNASGTQLAVTASVTFQASFGGTWNDYLIAYDNEGLNTTWQQMGTWTVPAAPNFSLTLSCPQNMQVWVQSVCTVTAVPSGGFNQSINLALGIAPLVGGWLFDSPPAPLAPRNWTSPVHSRRKGARADGTSFRSPAPAPTTPSATPLPLRRYGTWM